MSTRSLVATSGREAKSFGNPVISALLMRCRGLDGLALRSDWCDIDGCRRRSRFCAAKELLTV